MAGKWVEATLEDVCAVITDGAHSSPKDDPRGLPMASVKDLTRHGIALHGCRRISPADFESLKQQGCKPEYGDVLIAKDGNSALDTVCEHRLREEVVLLSSVAILRPNDKVTSGFLRYYLDSPETRALLKSGFRSGSAIPRVVLKDFRRAPVVVPPIEEQRAITHILGTLDDKVELNRQMNETLEAMAQALFKSWFVDFDPVRAKAEGRDPGLPKALAYLFPDSFEDSELGEIPRGWEVGRFGDAVEQLREQENPPSSQEALFHHFSIPAFDEGQSPKTEHGEGIKSLKWRVPAGVVLLSKLNPEIERVWLVDVRPGERSVCSTEFLVLSARSPFTRSFVYCLARSPLFRQQIEGLVTGTSKSHQRAQVDSILNLAIVVASSSIVGAFDRSTDSLLTRTLECRREARTLAALRDTLLPKLVSGELRVKDPEKFIERAAS
jgi:type I restriction enzyme S subunit